MRVYVAAKFEEKARARALMDALEAAGHEVTHDWTRESADGKGGGELAAYLRGCAVADLHGVLDCDAFVLAPHPRGKGIYTELGVAAATAKRIVAVGELAEQACVFCHLPEVEWVASDADAVAALDRECGCGLCAS